MDVVPVAGAVWGACRTRHYKTCTAIAALRHDRLCAPFVIDGAMTGEMFLACVEKQLLPELAPGDIVICDNLSAHKNPAVRKLLEEHRCQLRHLPAYSPDLNPIEQAFSKLKSDVRCACARQYEPLIHAAASFVRSFSAKLCKNLFAHANYTANQIENALAGRVRAREECRALAVAGGVCCGGGGRPGGSRSARQGRAGRRWRRRQGRLR